MTADLPPEAITAAAEAIRAEMKASREVEPGELARVALEAGAATTRPEWDGEPFIAAEGWREETEIRFVPESAVAEAVAAERSRIAASLRSLPVLDFLHRHGLEPGASGRPLLCAAAAEIEGPGAPGCEQHPGPSGVIPVRPKVSRRGRQEAGDG